MSKSNIFKFFFPVFTLFVSMGYAKASCILIYPDLRIEDTSCENLRETFGFTELRRSPLIPVSNPLNLSAQGSIHWGSHVEGNEINPVGQALVKCEWSFFYHEHEDVYGVIALQKDEDFSEQEREWLKSLEFKCSYNEGICNIF